MKAVKLFFTIFLALAVSTTAAAQARVGGKVVEIVDGKTVVIELPNAGRMTVELQYIEVPEAGQPLNQVVKEHLRALLEGKNVEVRAAGLTQNKIIGQVLSNGFDVSQQMIRDGAAWYAVLQKGGLSEAESVAYQSNEAQAKLEKRGVWSIENLKPAWQVRAEIAAEREKIAREIERQTAQQKVAAANANNGGRRRAAAPQARNDNFQMWADVRDYAGNVGAAGALDIQYDSSLRVGYAATTRAVQNLTATADAKNSKQKVDVRMAYAYRDSNRGRESVYLVGVLSEGADYKFLKSNSLTIFADGQKLVLGNARRLYRQTAYSAQELLIYRISRAAVAKIAGAKKLQVKLGAYSGDLNADLQAMLKNLLQASA